MKKKWSALFDDQSVVFDFDDATSTLFLDKQKWSLHVQKTNEQRSVVFCDGHHYDVVTCFSDGRWHVLVDGLATSFVLEDERGLRRHVAGNLSQLGGDVKTPMPGRVVKVLVGMGDRVEKGQGVAVVEAMKMENEFKASCAGVVTEILVNPGDTVEAGKVLVKIV
jgi:biotin carboxyl carrier protein